MDRAAVCSILLLLVCYVYADSPYYEALAAHAETKKYEPMVAFECGRPAMYRSEAGWQLDRSQDDCLTEAVDILDYCKKKYPDEDIRNIVEASEMYTITNWCPRGHKHCKRGNEQTVRPFRCLVGEFQSDALLVPPHCNFSHEHNAKKCMDFFEWSAAATGKCELDGLKLQSFAMLQPCGLKVFTGVEFVCCPPVKDQGSTKTAKKVINLTEKEKQKQNQHLADKPKKMPQQKPLMNAYEKYLRFSEDGDMNEHQRFRAAIKVWQEEHHQKIRNMMKDWSAARKHVTDLRATDPKSAATLNKDLTERFQKMYQALEADGAAKKRQLVAIHQQRIQAKLNLKKRMTMENYLRALEDEDPTEILKALEHYIRAEEKDRIHTVNHYEHVREIDADDADRALPQTKEHLKVIEQRIHQSLEMLQRVPQYKDKIGGQINEFMKNYHSVDETVKHVIMSPRDDVTKGQDDVTKTDKPVMSYDDEDDEEEEEEEDLGADVGQKIDDGGLYEKKIIEVKPLQQDQKPESFEDEKPEKVVEPVRKVPVKPLDRKKAKNGRFDIETTENEHRYLKVEKPVPKASHAQDNSFSVSKAKLGAAHASSTGSVFGIAIGSVAVFVIIIVTIVVMRKKAQRTPTTTGFVEIEQPSSPEEKHVANMQMNGYENPTYKYFETGTPKAC